MRRNKKKNKLLLLLVLLLGIGIGYAALTASLKINGTTNISGNSWDIYWDDPIVTDGSVTNTLPTITQDTDDPLNTKLVWNIDLDLPGDFYEYTIYVVNNGTMDTMITNIENTANPTLPDYIKCEVTYVDGVEPSVGDKLSKKKDGIPTRVKYKVRVEFLNTITLEQMNGMTDDTAYSFTLGVTYGQAKDNAYDGFTFGDEIKYDPVSNTKCTSGSTCYTWNVIDVYDSKNKNSITLQRNTSFSGVVDWISQADYNDDAAYGTYGRNDKGPITLLKSLETLTSSWSNDLKVNYTYDTREAVSNYGVLTCTNGVCDINGNQITSNLKARVITGEEIALLTVAAGAEKNTPAYNWSLVSSNETDWFFFSRDEYKLGTNELLPSGETSPKTLKWLVANTINNSHSGATGNDSDGGGYWTLSPVSGDFTHAWSVGASIYEPYNGNLGAYYVKNVASYRLRPVITIPKSVLEN